MQNIQIVVFRWESGKRLMFKGPRECPTKLFLAFHDQQFDLITKPAPFLNKKYFCDICYRGYDHPERHTCKRKCYGCLRSDCVDINGCAYIPCSDCFRTFPGPTCDNQHQLAVPNSRSLCEKLRNCPECGRGIVRWRDGNTNHVCNGRLT